MERPKALGRWPNAPLAYLIAEIKFQRSQDFDKNLSLLIERLSDELPLEESSQSFEANMEPGKQPTLEPIRDFKNFQSTMGVRVTKGGFALHCTDYAGWSGGFRETWSALVEKVASALRPRVLLRSSMRCIDLLVPEGDESPDEMLADGLRPWNVGGGKLGAFEQGNKVMRFKDGAYATTVVVLSRVTGQLVLPPTVAAMSLAFSPIQQKALQFTTRTNRPFAILDSDAAHETAIPFDVGQILLQFEKLHHLSSTAFLDATTPEAQAFWRGGE